MRHPCGYAVVLGLCAAWHHPAHADIAYDALTNHPSQQWISTSSEMADDTILAPGAGLFITGITVRARESTINLTYIGSLTVSLYADFAGAPGSLLTTHTVPITLLPGQPAMDVFMDVPDVLAPSSVLWTSWMFEFPGTSVGSPTVPFNGKPSIGTSSEFSAYRDGAVGPWTLTTAQNGFAFRIESIPVPGVLVAVSAGAVLVARRRRAAVH